MSGERPFYYRGEYVPVQNNRTDWRQPMSNWRARDSTERQRREFETFACGMALIPLNLALAWTECVVAMLIRGMHR